MRTCSAFQAVTVVHKRVVRIIQRNLKGHSLLPGMLSELPMKSIVATSIETKNLGTRSWEN